VNAIKKETCKYTDLKNTHGGFTVPANVLHSGEPMFIASYYLVGLLFFFKKNKAAQCSYVNKQTMLHTARRTEHTFAVRSYTMRATRVAHSMSRISTLRFLLHSAIRRLNNSKPTTIYKKRSISERTNINNARVLLRRLLLKHEATRRCTLRYGILDKSFRKAKGILPGRKYLGHNHGGTPMFGKHKYRSNAVIGKCLVPCEEEQFEANWYVLAIQEINKLAHAGRVSYKRRMKQHTLRSQNPLDVVAYADGVFSIQNHVQRMLDSKRANARLDRINVRKEIATFIGSPGLEKPRRYIKQSRRIDRMSLQRRLRARQDSHSGNVPLTTNLNIMSSLAAYKHDCERMAISYHPILRDIKVSTYGQTRTQRVYNT